MAIKHNYTQYKEEAIEELFDEERSSEYDTPIENLLERNNKLNEEIRELKRDQEI